MSEESSDGSAEQAALLASAHELLRQPTLPETDIRSMHQQMSKMAARKVIKGRLDLAMKACPKQVSIVNEDFLAELEDVKNMTQKFCRDVVKTKEHPNVVLERSVCQLNKSNQKLKRTIKEQKQAMQDLEQRSNKQISESKETIAQKLFENEASSKIISPFNQNHTKDAEAARQVRTDSDELEELKKWSADQQSEIIRQDKCITQLLKDKQRTDIKNRWLEKMLTDVGSKCEDLVEYADDLENGRMEALYQYPDY